jgi:hypothetical protein
LSTTTTSLTNAISGSGTISNIALGTTLDLSGATLTSFSEGTYQVNVDETATQPTYSKITLGASPSLGDNTFEVLTTGSQASFNSFYVFSWSGAATGTPTLYLDDATGAGSVSGSGGTLTYYANSGVTLSDNSSDASGSSNGPLLLVDAGALQKNLKTELFMLENGNEKNFGMVTQGISTEDCVMYFKNNFLGCR